jgi:hypothetical protein
VPSVYLGTNGFLDVSGRAGGTVILDSTGNGGVTVSDNGVFSQFAPGQVRGVAVWQAGGTTYVDSTVPGEGLGIYMVGGPVNRVFIGNGGLDGIRDPVTVSGSNGEYGFFDYLYIEDENNANGYLAYTVTDRTISRSGAATIHYDSFASWASNITLRGSRGYGDQYFVVSTSAPTNVTTGSHSYVYVGSENSAAGPLGVRGINGPVYIDSTGRYFNNIYIDDQLDTGSRQVSVYHSGSTSADRIYGLAPREIAYNDINDSPSVDILTSKSSPWTEIDVPSLTVPTTLHTGTNTYVYLGWYLGNPTHTLANINSTLNIFRNHSVQGNLYITFDNTQDYAIRHVTYSYSLQNPGPSQWWEESLVGFGGPSGRINFDWSAVPGGPVFYLGPNTTLTYLP